MSETLNKGYIEKKEKGSGEYQELYLEGIEFLQNLSGANWTDYNEHDPGVTILENLVYTLTNLSHKIEMPIRDILTESKGETLTSGDNGFFIPSEILTTNPVIKEDYRKLLIDGIKNVKNVWVKTHNELQSERINDNRKHNLKGLYHIYVELYDYNTDGEKRNEEERRVKKEVIEIYNNHRNLCEDLYEVTILTPFFLDMTLALTIDVEADGEEVFAKIYYAINNYLAHEAKYESLWELKEQKLDFNDIYIGPTLANGFIKDTELHPQKNNIFLSELTKIISVVSGVVSIDFFEIKEDSIYKPPFVNEIKVPDRKLPRLRIPVANDKLSFSTADVELRPNIREIKRKYTSIEAAYYGSFKVTSKSMNIEDIPQGESLGLASYYSIREQFPAIYGIGQYGLPNASSKERKAQAQQLKAYLLPFDQLMTNFLSQLTHLFTLYDSQGTDFQTYFYQQLEDMPSLVDLLKRSGANKKKKIDQWEDTLRELNKQSDTAAIQRLNQVADNLLARYAEQFPTYVLQKINTSCFGKSYTDEEFDKKLLSWKRKLIADYGYLSYNRARSFDYSKTKEEHSLTSKQTPVIVDKISILLGIQYPEIRDVSQLINDKYLGFQKDEVRELSDKDKEEIKTIEHIIHVLKSQMDRLKTDQSHFVDFLTRGVFSENYKIVHHKNKKRSCDLLLQTETASIKIAHIDTLEKAEKAKEYAISIFKKIDEKSEGIHLIEHLLLAPPVTGDYFGFSFMLRIKDEEALLFKQEKLLSTNNRNGFVASIKEKYENKEVFTYQYKNAGGNYWIEILNSNKRVVAISEKHFEYLHEVKELVEKFTSSTNRLVMDTINYYSYYGTKKINESFFSFNMSFVLPSWPIRFQKESFRKQFNNIAYKHSPIHIKHHTYWLDLIEITAFETSYYKWRKALSKTDKKARMPLAYDLIKKINNYQNR